MWTWAVWTAWCTSPSCLGTALSLSLIHISGQQADYEAILRDIQQRDYQDSHRETAPLRPAEDAVLLDNSDFTFQPSVERLVGLVRERL